MTWLDDLFGTAKSAASTVVSSIADIPAEWSAKVNELKARAAEFMQLFNDLSSRADQAAAAGMSAEYNALMSRGASIKAQVQQVTSAIDNVYNSVSNLFGLSGAGFGELGIIPLIPIAIIVGAIALLVKWISDAYTMRNKLAAATAAGANAAQLTQIATGSSGSIFSTLTSPGSLMGNAGVFLLIGAGVLLLVPMLKRVMKR